MKHASTAKNSNAKKIIAGECGHQHKAMMTIGDRILLGELEKSGISYGGLVELIVNAMVGIKEPYITWE